MIVALADGDGIHLGLPPATARFIDHRAQMLDFLLGRILGSQPRRHALQRLAH